MGTVNRGYFGQVGDFGQNFDQTVYKLHVLANGSWKRISTMTHLSMKSFTDHLKVRHLICKPPCQSFVQSPPPFQSPPGLR